MTSPRADVDSLIRSLKAYKTIGVTEVYNPVKREKKPEKPAVKPVKQVLRAPVPEKPGKTQEAFGELDAYRKEIENCRLCSLGKTRINFVFGSGDPKAELVFIGEAPGADEDEQGLPFVGRAGEKLTQIIESVKFKREETYILNVLKCRPPQNRAPLPEEVEKCLPYLVRQIEIIKPKLICCLGASAARALLDFKSSLGSLRGKLHSFMGIPVIVTYHPAAIFRNPAYRLDIWKDIKFVKKEYDKLVTG